MKSPEIFAIPGDQRDTWHVMGGLFMQDTAPTQCSPRSEIYWSYLELLFSCFKTPSPERGTIQLIVPVFFNDLVYRRALKPSASLRNGSNGFRQRPSGRSVLRPVSCSPPYSCFARRALLHASLPFAWILDRSCTASLSAMHTHYRTFERDNRWSRAVPLHSVQLESAGPVVSRGRVSD